MGDFLHEEELRAMLPGIGKLTQKNVFKRIFRLLTKILRAQVSIEAAEIATFRNYEIVECFVDFCYQHKIPSALLPNPVDLHKFSADAIEDFSSCLRCLDAAFDIRSRVAAYNKTGAERLITVLIVSDSQSLSCDFYNEFDGFYQSHEWRSRISLESTAMFESFSAYDVICVLFQDDFTAARKLLRVYKKKTRCILLIYALSANCRKIGVKQLKAYIAECRDAPVTICYKTIYLEQFGVDISKIYRAVVKLACMTPITETGLNQLGP